MAVSFRKDFCVPCSWAGGRNKSKPSSSGSCPWKTDFRGGQVVLRDSQAGSDGWAPREDHAVHAPATSVCSFQSIRWWEKCTAPNMIEIGSAQELVDSLLNAGDRLVVIEFYCPCCAGCKALHPKIGEFAESNPDVLFLMVNYEEHKSMCYSLNVRVLPLFRFYRGAQGRVCSFSCTNATIKKFKDAMAKHRAERQDLGPAKGLEESELLKLASNGELHFKFP